MRKLLVATSALAIGALGLYVATRGGSGQTAQDLQSTQAPSVAVARPAEPARPALSPSVTAARAATTPAAKPVKTMALRRKPSAPAAIDRSIPASAFADGRSSQPEASTAAYRPENAASPATIARREKSANPMDSRWVSGLSGANAHLGFARKSTDLSSCASTRNCERKPAPEQAWVAGVVVTSERLVAEPTQPLDGKVARGSYLDETPGVYVK